MLDAADGPVVEIEDITKISNESLVFEQTLGAEARYSIIVYDSGYVWFKEQFYFIDSDASYTSKIFNTVRMNCDAEPYYWNKQKKKWEIGDQDTSVSEDTSPKTSEDYGLGIDETDVDIPYETEIHY